MRFAAFRVEANATSRPSRSGGGALTLKPKGTSAMNDKTAEDTTVKKVSSRFSPTGPVGQTYLADFIEPFTAIEATSPPAEVHGRDAV